MTWTHWLTYDAFAARRRSTPVLFVHSDDAVLPDNAQTVADRPGDLATVVWTEGEQTDFYDQPEQVDVAVARPWTTSPPGEGSDGLRSRPAPPTRFFRAVDTRDWDRLRGGPRTPGDALDYVEIFGGSPEIVTAEALVTGGRPAAGVRRHPARPRASCSEPRRDRPEQRPGLPPPRRGDLDGGGVVHAELSTDRTDQSSQASRSEPAPTRPAAATSSPGPRNGPRADRVDAFR